jgi:hypothetical protein
MTFDPNEQTWYPSCVVKLTLRYDESLQRIKPQDETTLDAMRAQTQESRTIGKVGADEIGSSVGAVGDPLRNPSGKHRPRRALENAALAQIDEVSPSANLAPTSQALTPGGGGVNTNGGSTSMPTTETEPLTLGTDSFTVIANRVPRKGSFRLPHPRTAPEFELTFDYSEFPVDPQILRACGVEIHIGSVSADDFARGMIGELDEDGRPLSILKTTTDVVDQTTGRKQLNTGTLLFYGTADTWDIEHSDADSTIVIKGREIRAILIDVKIKPSLISKLKLDQPIDRVISDLLKTIPFEHGFRMTVATDVAEWPNGIVPSPGDAGGMTRVRIKAASSASLVKPKLASGSDPGVQTGDAGRSTPGNGSGANYWDLITNYCEICGAMPYVVGSVLWIRPVHRVFDIVDPNSRIPTPFAGGRPRQSGEETIRARRLVLGRDIEKLSLQRKFGGVAIVPTVQCISFDDKGVGRQRLIFGQWPPKGSSAAEAKAENELLRVPMWGITSVERLTQIARGIYEEVGRGETGGTASTNNLASFGGLNSDPDMLRIRPLEPIQFVVDQSSRRVALPVISERNDIERLSFSEEVKLLHERLGDLAVARAMTALARGAIRELIQYYQIVGVNYEWDRGIKTSIQFQNYIIPRHAMTAASDLKDRKQISATKVKVTGAGRKAQVQTSPRATPPPDPTAPTSDAVRAVSDFAGDSSPLAGALRRLRGR